MKSRTARKAVRTNIINNRKNSNNKNSQKGSNVKKSSNNQNSQKGSNVKKSSNNQNSQKGSNVKKSSNNQNNQKGSNVKKSSINEKSKKSSNYRNIWKNSNNKKCMDSNWSNIIISSLLLLRVNELWRTVIYNMPLDRSVPTYFYRYCMLKPFYHSLTRSIVEGQTEEPSEYQTILEYYR